MSVHRLPHRLRIEVERPCLRVHFRRNDDDISLANARFGIVEHRFCAERGIQTEVDDRHTERFLQKLGIDTECGGAAANYNDFCSVRIPEPLHLVVKFAEKRPFKLCRRKKSGSQYRDKRQKQQKHD